MAVVCGGGRGGGGGGGAARGGGGGGEKEKMRMSMLCKPASKSGRGILSLPLTSMKWHHSAETRCNTVRGSEGRSKLPLQGLQQDALAGATCCGPHCHAQCRILFQQDDAAGASCCSPDFRELASHAVSAEACCRGILLQPSLPGTVAHLVSAEVCCRTKGWVDLPPPQRSTQPLV